jgi:hypothetical protein
MRENFLLHLGALIRRIHTNSRSADEAEAILAPTQEAFDSDIPQDLRPLVYQEARRLLPTLSVSGEYYTVPISSRPRFSEDLPGVQQRVFSLVESKCRGNAPPATGLRGLVTEEEFQAALTEAIGGDTRYSDGAGRAFVSFGVRSLLSAYNYSVLPAGIEPPRRPR